ncbi:kinase-like domain-containing protein [Mycena sanguinolenta]|nr:kinase-like domain-containing protein [Mycena sanguinolenta]
MQVVASNTFVWRAGDDFEDATKYGPGGLFPVKLGDALGPENSVRYRIATKLSHGSHSTVWLAEDLKASRAVAVKIVDASESATSREEAILKHLCTTRSDTPAVLQLLDSFETEGVNGMHLVLVTEPVILLPHLLKLPAVKGNLRNIARQALEGLAFIHERGVVHRDLRPDNLGVAIPNLDSFSADDIWTRTGPPEVFPLVARDPAHDTASFPPYLTQAMDGEDLVTEVPEFAAREPCLRIMDFGCASFARKPPSPSPRCPDALSYLAPEIAFPRIAHDNLDGWRVDIWSMGCTLYRIASGGLLFRQSGTDILDEMATCSGGAPEEWISYLASELGKDQLRAYTPEMAGAFWDTRAGCISQRAGHFGCEVQAAKDAHELVALLRRMVVMDPKKRPLASELLQDPYFKDGIP